MAYRPARIEVRRNGRHSYTARLIHEDDGLPDRDGDGCPVHGYEGIERDAKGVVSVPWPEGCECPVFVGIPLEDGPFNGRTYRRAWRKAWKAAQAEGGLTG